MTSYQIGSSRTHSYNLANSTFQLGSSAMTNNMATASNNTNKDLTGKDQASTSQINLFN